MWRSRVLIGVQETSAALHSGSSALGCGKFWTLVGMDAQPRFLVLVALWLVNFLVARGSNHLYFDEGVEGVALVASLSL